MNSLWSSGAADIAGEIRASADERTDGEVSSENILFSIFSKYWGISCGAMEKIFAASATAFFLINGFVWWVN